MTYVYDTCSKESEKWIFIVTVKHEILNLYLLYVSGINCSSKTVTIPLNVLYLNCFRK